MITGGFGEKRLTFNIAVISGDGVGPEICEAAKKVLTRIAGKFGHRFNFTEVLMGGASIDIYGSPLIKDELDICLKSDAVLLGAIGGPKWDDLESDKRPEKGLLNLRQKMKLYANLRPSVTFSELYSSSPLKPEILNKGLDILIVRELTGGIYFGNQKTMEDELGIVAFDTEKYYEYEIERILKVAFEQAQKRRNKLTSVDKANILETSRLWRRVLHKLSPMYPDVKVNEMYVDNCAMQLVKNPSQFDVIVTSNMFGDILSDELAALGSSIGMMPSCSIGEDKLGLYEPIHGSAPDIADKDIANPIGIILATAMMLRQSFGLKIEANAVEKAVAEVIKRGYRTKDIYNKENILVGTAEMGGLIEKFI